VTDDSEALLWRLIGGDAAAVCEIREKATADTSASMLVAAALVSDGSDELIARAAAVATSTRDRQLVALAAAHLDGDDELLDVLVRDHLADHPDNVLAAWIASHHARSNYPEHLPSEEAS
jgi:hypothetical protein